LKCVFGDVDEALLHDIRSPFECIFHILGIQKSDFDEVVEVMIEVGEWP
jgi:hypothetical protein